MANPREVFFRQLRERLLRAGVAPRHVRRCLAELRDHLTDVLEEEQRTHRAGAKTEAAALARLGSLDEIARAIEEQPQLRSWAARAPWAVFGIAPLAALALAWCVALFLLWSGWRIFLPGAATPFVRIHGMSIAYFGCGRLIFFASPLLIGWASIAIAIRQRITVTAACFATLLLALAGATARVHALRIEGHPRVGLAFVLGQMLPNGPILNDPIAWVFSGVVSYILAVLMLTLLPYAAWRFFRPDTPLLPV